MRQIYCLVVIVVMSLGLPMTGAVQAADIAAGKVTAENVCQTCHGMDGISIHPMGANLGGQQLMYMKAQLEAYRDGKRQHEQMSIIAKMLSDEDIANVIEWYSKIKVTLEMPDE